MNHTDRVDYQTAPSRYRHWKLKFDGPVATLLADFDENGGLRPGYKLKLNSYDLGVDIELNDAINRIRFERPEVRTVVITSARERVFCSGANIFMLGASSHAWKVNFCKFTNETRNGLEDSSAHGGLEIPGRGQRLLRGRRLRAGARLRRDHSHRRSLQRRQPARGAAARRVAGNGRTDAANRQAPCPPRSRGRLLHDERRRARREGFELAPRRRDRQAGAVRGQGARAGAGPRGDERPPLVGQGRRAHADRARHRSRCVALFACHGGDRPRSARRHLHDQGAERPSAAGRRGDRGRRRRLVSAGARPGAGGCDPFDAHATSSTSGSG